MARLPNPGGDNGNWGIILNDFLSQEHNSDGTLKKAGDIATAKSKAESAVQSINSQTPSGSGAVTLTAAHVGAEPSGLSTATQTTLDERYPLRTASYPATIPAALSWPTAYDPGASVIDVSSGQPAATVTKRPKDVFSAASTALTAPSATFYVATTGNDTTGSGTSGSPWRSIGKAVTEANATGQPTKIIVRSGTYTRTNSPSNSLQSPTVDIAFVADGRVRTGSFDFPVSPVVDATYTNTYSWTLANAERVLSTDMLDEFGQYIELLPVATPAICNVTPGSWCLSGGTMYVRRHDGSAPTNSNCNVIRGSVSQTFRILNHVNVYIGGIDDASGWDCDGGTIGVLYASISSGASSDKVICVENSTFRYAGGTTTTSRGVSIENWRGLSYFWNCSADGNATDGFNVHDTGSNNVRLLTVNCSARDNGRKGATSCNSWTLHETVTGVDIAGYYTKSSGGTVHNIGSSQAYLCGTFASGDRGDVYLGATIQPAGVMLQDNAVIWCDRVRVQQPSARMAYFAKDNSVINKHECWPTPQPDATASSGAINQY